MNNGTSIYVRISMKNAYPLFTIKSEFQGYNEDMLTSFFIVLYRISYLIMLTQSSVEDVTI